MSHLLREELIQWRDGLALEERERIVSHLGSCKACATAYAELVRTAPAQMAPARFNPADFVQRGYAVRKSTKQGWASALIAGAAWKAWTAGLGAAAAILLVALVLPRPDADTGGTRGGAIEFVAVPPSSAPPSIEWKTGIAATSYRVDLVDAGGRVFFTVTTATTRANLPQDLVAQLRTDETYEWRVTALDRDGTAITTGVTLLVPPASRSVVPAR